MERRLVLFASGFTISAALVGIFAGITGIDRSFLLVSAALAVLSCALIFTKRKYLYLPAFGAAFYFAFVFAYVALLFMPAAVLQNSDLGTFEGTAVTRGAVVNDLTYFTVKNDDGVKAVVTSYEKPDIALGDRVLVSGKIYVSNSSYDISKGVYLRVSAKSVENHSHTKLPAYLYPQYINYAFGDTARRMYPEEIAGFVSAIITGDKDGISGEFKDALIDTGLYHTVSVSGMHVSFIIGFLLLILPVSKRRSPLIIILAILCFMAVTGFTPSVCRAGIIGIMALGAPFLRRDYDRYTGIAASALVILLFNPFAILDYGFALSYTSYIGIIMLSEPVRAKIDKLFERARRKNGKILEYISSAAASTLSSFAFSLPLLALLFRQVSLVSVLANIACIWAISGIFLCGLFSVPAFLLYEPLGKLVSYAVVALYKYVSSAVSVFEKAPFASLGISGYITPLWIMFAYAAAIIFCILYKRRKAAEGEEARLNVRPSLYIFAIVATLSLCVMLSALERANTLEVAVLDVGQGQCVVASSAGKCAVFDCGGSSGKKSAETAARYLARNNFLKVDLLVISHYDKDHINGAESLFLETRIKTLAIPDVEDAQKQFMEQLARAHGAEVVLISQDYRADMGKTNITLYGNMVRQGTNDNDRSVAAKITLGYFDLIITGDLQESGERRFAEGSGLPDSEVIVAGHHGSKSSTTDLYLDKVKPEYALVSVGANYYGHPSPETLERLARRGIKYYITRVDGEIAVTARKNGYRVFAR